MVAQVEVPDGYRVVTLVGGESDGTPQIVQLDGTGRIVAVIQGEIEGITGPVDVSQTNSVRQIQGTDGSTLRTVKLDANGQIIMVPRGQSGNYMSVDASGFLTSVMKGDYTGTPTTLAVDSSGNIVAVIKGDFGGSLKTLATDDAGRLLIVPYDPDDIWGNAVGMGNAELAATLTPCKRYDRRGNVVWWTGFEQGIGEVVTAAVGTGAVICLSSYRCLTGPYSCKIRAGSDSLHKGTLTRFLPFPVAGKMGVETAFSIDTDAQSIMIALYFDDGVHYGYGELLWEESTDDLKVRTGVSTWTTVDANRNLYTNLNTFHKMKVVMDFSAWKYVRANVNEESYDLSAYSMYNTNTISEGLSFAQVEFIGESGKNAVCYIDDLILTQNEPA